MLTVLWERLAQKMQLSCQCLYRQKPPLSSLKGCCHIYQSYTNRFFFISSNQLSIFELRTLIGSNGTNIIQRWNILYFVTFTISLLIFYLSKYYHHHLPFLRILRLPGYTTYLFLSSCKQYMLS